jgi:hypothetical protein
VKQSRWTSPDPAGRGAADPSNPQTWNLYAYVMNNPLSLRDPSGLIPYGGPSAHGNDAYCDVESATICDEDSFESVATGRGYIAARAGVPSIPIFSFTGGDTSGYTLPSDPSDVGRNPNWQPDPKFDPQRRTRPGTRQWVDGNGNRLRFDPKDARKSPKTHGGKDHYHYNDGDEHLQPGDTVPDPTPHPATGNSSGPSAPDSGAPSGPGQQEMQNAAEATGVIGTILLILYTVASAF